MSQDHNAPEETPWGLNVYETKYTEHIFGVETAEHGGVYLTPEQQKKIPDELKVHSIRGEGAWWDASEAWAIPVLYIAYKQPKDLEANIDVEYAEKMVREKYPHLLPLISGEISKKGNQQSLPADSKSRDVSSADGKIPNREHYRANKQELETIRDAFPGRTPATKETVPPSRRDDEKLAEARRLKAEVELRHQGRDKDKDHDRGR